MYKVEFLPIAKKDIDSIIYYVSHNLNNISAAKKLRDLFIHSIDNILEFPYGLSICDFKKSLKYEYRCYRVKNFLMFYTINEKEKIITIVRVLYYKMNIDSILE